MLTGQGEDGEEGPLDEGYLEAIERHADNSGQLESAYRLTRKGRRALASAAEAAPNPATK